MTLKAIWVAAAAAAICAGLALPVLRRQAEPKSQIQQIGVGRGS
jgi:hypothetical protein